jgi:CspA family cold shock protein
VITLPFFAARRTSADSAENALAAGADVGYTSPQVGAAVEGPWRRRGGHIADAGKGRNICPQRLAGPGAEGTGVGHEGRLHFRKAVETPLMATGTVKWFNNAKGFGFIRTDGHEADIFVHHTAIRADGYRTLKQGESVQFDLIEGPKGLKAENVLRSAL